MVWQGWWQCVCVRKGTACVFVRVRARVCMCGDGAVRRGHCGAQCRAEVARTSRRQGTAASGVGASPVWLEAGGAAVVPGHPDLSCSTHPHPCRAMETEGWKLVALLRLSPIAPWNVVNYALGVTALRVTPYALASSAAVSERRLKERA